MRYDIITVGSAVVDVFLDTNTREKHGKICYLVGDKILIKKIRFDTGGGGTNTAVAFSKLGFKTGFVGKTGSDTNSEIILRELKKERIQFLGVRSKEHTGYSVILDSRERERTILTYKGANDSLKFSEVRAEEMRCKWLYCSSMIGESFRTQSRIIDELYKHGVKIAYNPSAYQIREIKTELKRNMKKIEVIILNKEEAIALAGHKNYFKILRALGPGIVCVTDGRNGSRVYDGKYLYDALSDRKIKCVERTGAGDAFASGFVAGLINSGSIEVALALGTLNAESVIQKPGAKNGLLSLKEAGKKIKLKIRSVKRHEA